MKFIADRMLGRLAKWMRALGLDAHYDKDIDRSSLIRIAKDEGRVILTRAQNFGELKHIPPFFIVKGEFLEGQLAEVFSEFPDLKGGGLMFTRCIECNRPLKDIPKEDISDRVPPKAYQMHDDYKICPQCSRVYWPGTHVEKMKRFLKKFR